MPITDKQRRYLFANNKGDVARKLMYRQEGGPVGPLAPVPSQVPGAAQGAIDTYMAGTAPLGISYEPGVAAAGQAERIKYQQDLRELQEAGVENAEDYVFQDYVDPDNDSPFASPEGWTDKQWDRFYTTGTEGHLISKDDRPAHMRGMHQRTKEEFLADMAARDEQGIKIPGVATALAGGIGGMMRNKMKAAVEAGGTPVIINGQYAVMNPDGSVIGNTGGIGAAGVRRFGQKKGFYTPKEFKFGNLFSSVGDIISGKKKADAAAAAARKAEAERQAAQAAQWVAANRRDINVDSGGNYQSDRDWNAGLTQHSINQLDENLGSSDPYSGSAGGFAGARNIGGPIMDDDDVWGADPLATLTDVQVAQRGRTPVAASMPSSEDPYAGLKAAALQQGVGMMFGDPFSAKKMALAGASTFLNAGGWVGRRTAYLVNGGMAQPTAEMQAYNEMQGMTGPNPVGAEFMMPEGSPMPEEYAPLPDHGYIPSGASQSYKEQMEADKLYIQQEKAMQDEDRKERAFGAAERRKDDTHTLQMQQKKEAHEETMKQKRAGPLAPNASTSIRG